jgi:hypothetical protein
MKYSARRATPADNFGPYLGPPGMALNKRFYAAKEESKAIGIARRLRARYVATTIDGRPELEMMFHRLHVFDGTGQRGQPPLAHFRLIVDDPPIGLPLGYLSGITRAVRNPFKLFEIVAGAVLEVAATPGSEVRAEVEIETSTQRRFRYRVTANANEQGIAHLRVPYATSTSVPSRPTGPYTVYADDRSIRVEVSDQQVLSGATLEVR